MKPPEKTTLARMQRTAMLEAERIEISQDARVAAGLLSEPMPYQLELRDDFVGMVRLIDAINSDKNLLERVKERMAASVKAAAAPAKPEEDVEIEVVD